jgi:anhydro-N-acetylmuramic acid kinase
MVAYNVVGVMSGTSGDGLDLALCEFTYDNHRWQYSVKKAETVPHPEYWSSIFDSAVDTGASDFIKLHNAFGAYIGDCINRFLSDTGDRVDIIASHGHTVCHRPHEGITFQLGSGSEIAACCKITTVSDFRSLDVALKGQGAPLVPAGDELLFGEYDFCLNLGGFANISFREGKARRAFDICPVNIIINKLANDCGLKMDRNGQLASRGSISHPLLSKLNGMEYYSRPFPKSLSREWLMSAFMPVVNESGLSTEDKLRTVCEHITMQIADCLERNAGGTVFVTGGGAFNKFLIGLLKQKCNCKIFIPDKNTVKYKEALVFGLLGVLRLRNEINCLSSATGSTADTSSGTIFYFNSVTK